MNRQRQIKGKDWNGYEYQYGIVLSEHSVGNWNTKCKLCSEIHVMQNRALRVGARSKKCKQYRSPNWTGFEREDAIIRRQYGISMQEFDKLLEFQKHGCAICNKPITKLSRRMNIDHDHKTGQVRGLLCSGCNTGLGQLGDDIEGLKRALKYLENPTFKQVKLGELN
jgi:hypothetical protein